MILHDAANVMTPAYLIILGKGYAVHTEGSGTMVAVKGSDRFAADGPVALLGVIVVAETRGVDWQATDEEIDNFVALFG